MTQLRLKQHSSANSAAILAKTQPSIQSPITIPRKICICNISCLLRRLSIDYDTERWDNHGLSDLTTMIPPIAGENASAVAGSYKSN